MDPLHFFTQNIFLIGLHLSISESFMFRSRDYPTIIFFDLVDVFKIEFIWSLWFVCKNIGFYIVNKARLLLWCLEFLIFFTFRETIIFIRNNNFEKELKIVRMHFLHALTKYILKELLFFRNLLLCVKERLASNAMPFFFHLRFPII